MRGVQVSCQYPIPDDGSDFLDMVRNVHVLEEKLHEKLELGSIQSLVFNGEIHESIFPIAMSHGLRMFFK